MGDELVCFVLVAFCLICHTEQNEMLPHCSYFKQESARFSEQALSIFRALSRVVSSFSNEEEQAAARRALAEAHRPQNNDAILGEHHKVA